MRSNKSINDEQKEIMRHALGLTRKDSPYMDGYRNYYAAEPDDKNCLVLVSKGMMQKGKEIQGGLQYFHVTNFGKEIASKGKQ